MRYNNMFYRVAVSIIILTLFGSGLAPALGALRHCASCDTESCSLSAAECGHAKRHATREAKEEAAGEALPRNTAIAAHDRDGHDRDGHGYNGHNGADTVAHVNESSGTGCKEQRPEKRDGCVVRLSCADTTDHFTVKPAEPHLITTINPARTWLGFLRNTCLKVALFKDPYCVSIDRPPATDPFYI